MTTSTSPLLGGNSSRVPRTVSTPTFKMAKWASIILLPMIPSLAFAADLGTAPAAAIAQVEERVNQVFSAESGKPLERAEKQKPLEPGRGNYVRTYSFSIVDFAARCLYLGEQVNEANAAIAENARHYLDNPKDINDRDSFHWHADIVMRLLELYGPHGTRKPGLITPETEALALKPIWEYVRKSSRLERAGRERARNWEFSSTENHHAMDFTVCWHFAKIAKDHPDYKDLKFDDGATAAQHYQAWNEYFVVYCEERARKGACIEIMCPGYNSVWLKGMYNFHDFGDERVSRSARMLIDLYLAYWAQEQIDGVEGGGKTRIRGLRGLARNEGGVAELGWLYFGIGKRPASFSQNLNAALSKYRPPVVVADIALNSRSDGPYEVIQRAQGLGEQGVAHPDTAAPAKPNKFRTDGGGIVRYSYCDPAFTLGTLMTEAKPLKDWVSISAQGRWQGVNFAGKASGRIVPMVLPTNRDVLNAHWSVQRKGCLITQKLRDHKGGGKMVVWMSSEGLSSPTIEDDVVFVESEGAYAAIQVASGGFELQKEAISVKSLDRGVRSSPAGVMVVPKMEDSPVILEVMAKSQVNSFGEFKKQVLACEMKMDGAVLKYQSIYGDTFTFDSSYLGIPTINGKPVDYAPKKVLESPFLNADYDAGVVTISRNKVSETLDFMAD
jgi:hypothetical protein